MCVLMSVCTYACICDIYVYIYIYIYIYIHVYVQHSHIMQTRLQSKHMCKYANAISRFWVSEIRTWRYILYIRWWIFILRLEWGCRFLLYRIRHYVCIHIHDLDTSAMIICRNLSCMHYCVYVSHIHTLTHKHARRRPKHTCTHVR